MQGSLQDVSRSKQRAATMVISECLAAAAGPAAEPSCQTQGSLQDGVLEASSRVKNVSWWLLSRLNSDAVWQSYAVHALPHT
jgi:hypothetical protein